MSRRSSIIAARRSICKSPRWFSADESNLIFATREVQSALAEEETSWKSADGAAAAAGSAEDASESFGAEGSSAIASPASDSALLSSWFGTSAVSDGMAGLMDSELFSKASRVEKMQTLSDFDSHIDKEFGAFLEMTADVFKVQIASITFHDKDRTWVQPSCRVAKGDSVSRSFNLITCPIEAPTSCYYVPEVYLSNVERNALLCSHPAVVGDPKIRFYASAPLTESSGIRIGSLSILDSSPRTEDPDRELRILKSLASFLSNAVETKKRAISAEVAKKHLQDSEKVRSSVFAQTAHEIKNPLTSILGIIDLMLHSSETEVEPLTEQQSQYLYLMKEAGTTMHKLLCDVLDLSKIEANKLIVEQVEFNAKKLASDVVEMFKPRCTKNTIKFENAGAKDEIVIGDPTRLRQVLWNFTSNAIKFTPFGEIIIRIQEVESVDTKAEIIEEDRLSRSSGEAVEEQEKVYYKFDVIDSGIGMTESQLKMICQPFKQAEDGATSRKYGGTGLGLVICNKLINLMGGKLTIRTAVGSGSTFSFTIPFIKSKKAETEVEAVPIRKKTLSLHIGDLEDSDFKLDKLSRSSSVSGPSSPGKEPESQLKILIADDNPTVRLILHKQIKNLGHQCFAVSNGSDALKLLKDSTSDSSDRFDAFFCDMNMPGMSGLETIEAIRKLEDGVFESISSIPIILFTGDEVLAGRDSFQREFNIMGVLPKPIDVARLRSLLLELLLGKVKQ